jgi:hypothetical protein
MGFLHFPCKREMKSSSFEAFSSRGKSLRGDACGMETVDCRPRENKVRASWNQFLSFLPFSKGEGEIGRSPKAWFFLLTWPSWSFEVRSQGRETFLWGRVSSTVM